MKDKLILTKAARISTQAAFTSVRESHTGCETQSKRTSNLS